MKYYRTYKLKKDLPEFPIGWLFSWCGVRQMYIPHEKDWRGGTEPAQYGKDYSSKTQFTKQEVESKTDWFQSFGKASNFTPPFPSQHALEEFVYLKPETRLVDDVDICRCLNELFDDEGFEERHYRFVKEEYEKKFDLLKDTYTPTPTNT